MGKLSPRLIGLVIIVIVLLAGLAFVSGTQFRIEYNDGHFSLGWAQPTEEGDGTQTAQTWYGYFNDWNATLQTEVMEEVLSLQFQSGNRVRISSKGDVIGEDGRPEQHEWHYSGFSVDGYLVLSYIGVKGPPYGIGTMFLMQSRRDYIGTWEGRDPRTKTSIRCPYALTHLRIGVQQAKHKWESLLSRKCEEVQFEWKGRNQPP